MERDELEGKVNELFETPRGVAMSPSPFLKGQTLARIRELERESRAPARSGWGLRIPKWSIAGLATAALAAVWFYAPGRGAFVAPVGKELVVLVHEEGQQFRTVSAVQVELPEGVRFHSDEFPQLAGQAVLTLPWQAGAGPDSDLPVVIQSTESGLKRIKIRYLDSEQREVTSREMRIRFKQPSERRI